MIRIERGTQKPTLLIETDLQFNKEIIGMSVEEAYEYYGKCRHKYNTLETKSIFEKMNQERCSFCSMVIKDFDGEMTIEHIKLKKDFPNLIFNWDNLLCSCRTCNTKRSIKPYVDNLYLDPTRIIDIEEYFIYEMDGTIKANPDLDDDSIARAEYMIDLYKLNRKFLVRDRKDFREDLLDETFSGILEKCSNLNKHIICLGLYNYTKEKVKINK